MWVEKHWELSIYFWNNLDLSGQSIRCKQSLQQKVTLFSYYLNKKVSHYWKAKYILKRLQVRQNENCLLVSHLKASCTTKSKKRELTITVKYFFKKIQNYVLQWCVREDSARAESQPVHCHPCCEGGCHRNVFCLCSRTVLEDQTSVCPAVPQDMTVTPHRQQAGKKNTEYVMVHLFVTRKQALSLSCSSKFMEYQ